MNDILLRAEGLRKNYRTGKESVKALLDVSLSLGAKEIKMIVGPSGSGKTTLLNLLGGLDFPDEGSVYFLNRRIDNLHDAYKTELRRKSITLVFQGFELIPVMSCFDNIAYPLKLLKLNNKDIRKKVEFWSERFHIENLLRRKPNQISIGQKQRVAIVRSLIVEPVVVLGDEMTANLDRENTKNVLNTIREIATEKNTGFILVTHDSSILSYADQVFSLSDGEPINTYKRSTMILQHAFLNLFRNGRRTAMAMALLVISMVLLFLAFCYLEGMYWALRYGYSLRSGSVQIAGKGYWDPGEKGKSIIPKETVDRLSAILEKTSVVSSFSQELSFSGLIGTASGSTVVNGIAVELAAKGGGGSGVSILEGRRIIDEKLYEIVIGEGVAHTINVGIGDWVTVVTQTLSGALNPLSFQVAGIATTGIKEADNFYAISDMMSVRDLLEVDSCERLLVFLNEKTDPREFLVGLQRTLDDMSLEGKTWMELSPTFFDLKGFYDSIFIFMMAIIIVLVCISIFELVSITFFERFKEIGTLRAIGTKKLEIFILLIAESLLLFVSAFVVSVIVGWVSGSLINSMHLSWRPPGASNPVPFQLQLKLNYFVTPLIAGLSSILPGAIFPAWRASRLSVIGVLRNE